MPSFKDCTEKDWAGLRASTKISTYEVFNCLQHGVQLPSQFADNIEEMKTAGWLSEGDNGLEITDAGFDHLKSFS